MGLFKMQPIGTLISEVHILHRSRWWAMQAMPTKRILQGVIGINLTHPRYPFVQVFFCEDVFKLH